MSELDVDDVSDAYKHPITEYDAEGVGATGAREVVVELGRDLADETDHPRELFLLNEDAMEGGNYSLRVLTTSRTLTADLLAAVGRQGFALTYLGERETSPRTHEWMIETGGDVHGRVY